MKKFKGRKILKRKVKENICKGIWRRRLKKIQRHNLEKKIEQQMYKEFGKTFGNGIWKIYSNKKFGIIVDERIRKNKFEKEIRIMNLINIFEWWILDGSSQKIFTFIAMPWGVFALVSKGIGVFTCSHAPVVDSFFLALDFFFQDKRYLYLNCTELLDHQSWSRTDGS